VQRSDCRSLLLYLGDHSGPAPNLEGKVKYKAFISYRHSSRSRLHAERLEAHQEVCKALVEAADSDLPR
jgi:hypothetical protein